MKTKKLKKEEPFESMMIETATNRYQVFVIKLVFLLFGILQWYAERVRREDGEMKS